MEELNPVNYSDEIQRLEEWIKFIDDSMKFNITIFLAVLGIAVAILGAAMYFLAKSLVNTAIESRAKQIESDLTTLVQTQLDNLKQYSISESGENVNGHYFRWENGIQVCYNKVRLTYFTGDLLSSICITSAQFTKIDSLQATILNADRNMTVTCNVLEGKRPNDIKIDVRSGDRSVFSENDTVMISLLVIGKWK